MNQLFLLLRLGLGLESAQNADVASFNVLSEKDWESIKSMAESQGISAIALDGINELISHSDISFHSGVSKTWWKSFLLKWSGSLLLIEQENQYQIAIINHLADVFSQHNVRMLVMKGQANGLMYPKPLHRTPGDIDCYLFKDYAKGNELARKLRAEVNEEWYKHSSIQYKGQTIENHRYFVHTREGKRSKLLQNELEEGLNNTEWNTFSQSNVLLPPVQWNAKFLTYHACAHFLTEGLRLKQVLDWAMFLDKEQENVDWAEFYAFCDRYHLRRFTDAMTSICKDYLSVRISNKVITTVSPYKERIITSTLFDDDYIYNAGESQWKSRLHVVKSLFKYRWKYKEIYQQSVWKQLWWYISGFIFRIE